MKFLPELASAYLCYAILATVVTPCVPAPLEDCYSAADLVSRGSDDL